MEGDAETEKNMVRGHWEEEAYKSIARVERLLKKGGRRKDIPPLKWG